MRALGLVLLLSLSACCVARDEHASFVAASRAFFDVVAPVYSAAVLGDVELTDRNKKNRLGVVEDYHRALRASEDRVR